MSLEQFAETLLEKLKWMAQAETVIGKAIQTDQATIVPVSRVSVGFGLGNSKSKGELTGSGGGASVEPVAFLVIKGDDVKVLTVGQSASVMSKVLDLVPDIMETFKKDKHDL